MKLSLQAVLISISAQHWDKYNKPPRWPSPETCVVWVEACCLFQDDLICSIFHTPSNFPIKLIFGITEILAVYFRTLNMYETWRKPWFYQPTLHNKPLGDFLIWKTNCSYQDFKFAILETSFPNVHYNFTPPEHSRKMTNLINESNGLSLRVGCYIWLCPVITGL